MTNRQEGAFALAAALFVLFSATFDPRISLVIATIALGALGVYNFYKR